MNNHINRLNLEKEDIPEVVGVVQGIFEKIYLFNTLKTFQKEVNAEDLVYLPTTTKGFSTSTPSKKQSQNKKKSEGRSPKTTAMSRIFTSCEVVLILYVFLTLADFPDLVPIAYEADGLLLAGYFENKEDLIKQINERFQSLANSFIKEEFALEFKH